MYILLLLLCSWQQVEASGEPSLPPIAIEDRFYFGALDRRQTSAEWQYLCDLERRIVELRELNRLMRRPMPSCEMIAECTYAQQAWNLYDNVAIYAAMFEQRNEDYAYNAIIESLTKLRDHIGWRNYYGGRLPSTRPLRDLEAAMNEVW